MSHKKTHTLSTTLAQTHNLVLLPEAKATRTFAKTDNMYLIKDFTMCCCVS